MIVVMQERATEAQVAAVTERLEAYGFAVQPVVGGHQTVLGAAGVQPDFDVRHIQILGGVASVARVTSPYKYVGRSWQEENTVIDVKGVAVGGEEVIVMAGPCSVESEEQLDAAAAAVAAEGATFLRGGAFKPRTSPYSFQGLGEEGLRLLRTVADRHGLRVITEVMTPSQVDLVAAHADVFQIGARNMQNFDLLRAVGQTETPVFLKRGLSATIKEWLMSAEYVMASGNPHVILCERGIRTFESSTRNTLDLSAVPVVKQRSHLPVFVDPSHAVGLRDKVVPLARAAVAVGADGLLVEVHPDPPRALSDGPQSLFVEQFSDMMRQLRLVADAVGRPMRAAHETSV
ncbi:MAG: 3-deoxy-7-phosphoheptulonate synthase [Bacteroidota bacterium]